MRLTELEPRWLDSNTFAFLCPHCKKDILTCKRAPMSDREQHELFEKEFGPDWNTLVVGCNTKFCWKITGNFDNLTVQPSIDASASGHWHGWITGGEVR